MIRFVCWFLLIASWMPLLSGAESAPRSLLGASSKSADRPSKRTHAFSLVQPPLRVRKGVIVVDPGHGGHDVGTQSISKPRYQEKTLNLATAKFLRRYLQKMGYRVLMTREEDKFIPLDKRAQFANGQKAILFVSVHYNSAPSAEAHGVEVFFYPSKLPSEKERLLQSKRLAHDVLKQVIACTHAKSRGVKQANYAVIRETTMPAILVEGGFVTNAQELERLKDPAYLRRIAWGIARGIQEYLNPPQDQKAPRAAAMPPPPSKPL